MEIKASKKKMEGGGGGATNIPSTFLTQNSNNLPF
jgi:hypothetical protein